MNPRCSLPLVLHAVFALWLLGCSTDLSPPTARLSIGSVDGGGVAVGAPVSLDGAASSDPNGEPLAYHFRIVSVPLASRATVDRPDAMATWIIPDVAGDYTIELIVSDGALTSAPATATFTAGPCGAGVPTVKALTGEPAAPKAGDAVLLSADVTDPDLDPSCRVPEHLSYLWSLVELPPGSHATLNDPGTQAPSLFTDEPGAYRVELVVTDAAGHSSKAVEATLTVGGCPTPVPDLASVSATPLAPDAGQRVSLSAVVNGASSAPPAADGGLAIPAGCLSGFIYHWALVSVPPGSDAALSSPEQHEPSFVPDLPGTYVAELFVENARGARSVTAQVTVQAGTCGSRAPTLADIKVLPAAPAVGQVVALETSASDADSLGECGMVEHFQYAWSIEAAPPGSTATLNDVTLAAPSFTADAAGSYTVRVVARDSEGHVSAERTRDITVSACGTNAPVVGTVTATPSAPSTGSTVLLSATVTDADTASPCKLTESYTLTWALAAVPAGSTATLSGTDQTTPWFRADVPGKYTVEARATDASGRTSVEKTLDVTASTCGSAAPSVTSLTASPASPLVGASVSLTPVVSDSDVTGSCKLAESFRYAWALTAVPSGSTATLTSTSSPLSGFVPDKAGSYTIALVVMDSEGHASARSTQTVTATAVPTPTCGVTAPVARLASVTAGPCGSAVCPAVTTTPAASSPPSATPPGYVVRLNGHVSVRLDASGSTDADNLAPCNAKQTLSDAWSILVAPVGSKAAWSIGTGPSTSLVAPTFVPDLPGIYQVGLVVSDGSLSSRQLVVQIEL